VLHVWRPLFVVFPCLRCSTAVVPVSNYVARIAGLEGQRAALWELLKQQTRQRRIYERAWSDAQDQITLKSPRELIAAKSAAWLHGQERDRARETAAHLEEENALLLWLLAESEWKLQLESAKSWAREQAGKPYEGWNVLRRRRREQHSVWVMGACTCGAKCDGAASWKQHQYEVGAWVPQKGERVTGKSRGKYDPDPVGEFDSFSYGGTTAIINHVPPRYPAAVSDRTYVDADSLRPAPTVGPDGYDYSPFGTWKVGTRVTGVATLPDFAGEEVTGVILERERNQRANETSVKPDTGDCPQRYVLTASLRPAPTEPEPEDPPFRHGNGKPCYGCQICLEDTFIAEDTRQSRMADAADMETHGGELE
jgi:hypothetical protein